jgi:uridine kinase
MYQVILMDATVATGAAAMMAIRVLLDHDVPEENINLVSLLMAESGKDDGFTVQCRRCYDGHS